MSGTNKEIKKLGFAEIITAVSLLCVGTFHEYISCFLSVAMLIYIIVRAAAKKSLRLFINITSVSVFCIPLFYALSVFWAIDGGMAAIGVFKYLPVLLYLLILMQTESSDRVIAFLPVLASVTTVISAICMYIPPLTDYFSVSGRLCGFFEYPNTYAVFALACELIVISREKYRIWDFVMLAVTVFGILLSQSRTVFVIFVISNLVLILVTKSKKIKIITVSAAGAIALAAALYIAASGNTAILGRFAGISLGSSTFSGRLLYFRDALPLILKHPFGLGYMGYYYVQRSVQTGVYSVMYVHNEFLQILLDIGWVPGLLFIAAVFKSIFLGKKPFCNRVILCSIAMHCCFDFDLQYISVFMIMLLFTDFRGGREITLKKTDIISGVCFLTSAACIYFGIALALSHFNLHKAALSMYPFNTQSELQLLTEEKNKTAAENMADDILSRNKYAALAYTVKARNAFAKGDFKKVMEYKNAVLLVAPFSYSEYREYCNMLVTGVTLYKKAGDTESAKICFDELKRVADEVHNIKDRQSTLGLKISSQPVTRLSEKMESYIANGGAVSD